jgi:hypothetical protein
MRWRLFLEEFNPTFHYINGESNTLADSLSRLPRHGGMENSGPSQAESPIHNRMRNIVGDDRQYEHSFSVLMDDDEIQHCFLNFPDVDSVRPFALDYQDLASSQTADPVLQHRLRNQPNKYSYQTFGTQSTRLLAYRAKPEDHWRICLPTSKLNTIISFYHKALGHAGSSRIYQTISMHFHNPELADSIRQYVRRCNACQRFKRTQVQYSKLPPREADAVPWNTVAVDLIGPWPWIDPITGVEHQFNALTIIDVVTNYCEIIKLENKTAEHVAMQFENQWLARYP